MTLDPAKVPRLICLGLRPGVVGVAGVDRGVAIGADEDPAACREREEHHLSYPARFDSFATQHAADRDVDLVALGPDGERHLLAQLPANASRTRGTTALRACSAPRWKSPPAVAREVRVAQ